MSVNPMSTASETIHSKLVKQELTNSKLRLREGTAFATDRTNNSITFTTAHLVADALKPVTKCVV